MEYEDLFKEPEHLARANEFVSRVKNEIFPHFEDQTKHLGIKNITEITINAPSIYKDERFKELIQDISDSADRASVNYYFVNLSVGTDLISVVDEIYQLADAISRDLEAEFVFDEPVLSKSDDPQWKAFKYYRFTALDI